MELINELLKTALLGSEKTDVKQLFTQLPENIQQKLSFLSAENPEEAFLQLSSFVWPYYQAGKEFPVLGTNMEAANEESVPHATKQATQLLGIILNENRHLLVRIWLQHCAVQSCIVAPEFLPQLLDLGKEDITLQYMLKAVMGERGKWLAGLHEGWQTVLQTAEEIWDTGKAVHRKQLFRYLLQHNPQQAKTILQNSWQQESAADRFDFLIAWDQHISVEEVDFLEAVRQDKSNKVKALALQLLIKQPESSISREIRESCSQLLRLKDGGVFGMGQKNIVVNTEVHLLPLIEKMELEKESLQKNFSDQEYQVFQLLSFINPTYWEEQLGISSEKIFKQFIAGKALKKYVPAFAKAIFLHKNQAWATGWLQHIAEAGIQYEELQDDTFLILSIAPEETLIAIIENKKIDQLINLHALINLLGSITFSWSLKFSKVILHKLYLIYADRGVYHNELDKFLHLSLHLHPAVLQAKNTFLPKADEKRETWRAMIEELFRNIELKTKIQASFQV